VMSDTVLSGPHEKLIRDSGISADVARERGYRSVTIKTQLRDKGLPPSPGLLIPLYNARGECISYQFRPDEPRIREGKVVKYESVKGSRPVIDFHPRLSRPLTNTHSARLDTAEPPLVRNVSVPLILTEGARKADSAVTIGLCAGALSGVASWHRLPEWNDVPVKNREVVIIFDSDAMIKRPVWRELRNLKEWLETHRAHVSIVYLPPGLHGEKVGLDDYIAARLSEGLTDEAIRERIVALGSEELRPMAASAKDTKSGLPEIFIAKQRIRDFDTSGGRGDSTS
jgi:hypothetical protein